jgi:hypothetical protein
VLWNTFGYLQNPASVGGALVDTHFNGPLAIAAFDAVGGDDYSGGSKVPAENDNQEPAPVFGDGSLNFHWRESVFTTELMTPAIGFGASPLSLVTVESLHDMGYTVNPAGADPISDNFNLVGQVPAPVIVLEGDVWSGPIGIVDGQGRVSGTVQS